MQLYVAEYLADTSHLNAAQHGAYILLLMNYWQRGKALPDSNDRLAIVARMSAEEWAANRGVLAEFFRVENDLWTHGRVERDLLKVKGISLAGKIGGMASARARKEKSLNDRSKTVQRKVNQQNRTEQIKTEKKEQKQPTSGLPDWVDPHAWLGFEEMRKKERHPLTDRARTLAISELEKLRASGNDPTAVLNQSTMKGWRGLFAVNQTGGTNGTHQPHIYETGFQKAQRELKEQIAIAEAEEQADRAGGVPGGQAAV
jgi:uncharacterized protein YdaU (DUF1376 family)